MHKKMENICDIKNRLIALVEGGSLDSASVEVNGQIIDMIKDLSEAEEKCWKACYYKKIVEAMEEEEAMSGHRAGYDPWRYPSSGRFASTGHGKRMGYMPMDNLEYWEEFNRADFGKDLGRMGYKDSDSRYGKAYNQYLDARRHYTESGDMSAKMEMDSHTKEHLRDVMDTTRDIWKDASPEMRKKMKSDLTNLVSELTV